MLHLLAVFISDATVHCYTANVAAVLFGVDLVGKRQFT